MMRKRRTIGSGPSSFAAMAFLFAAAGFAQETSTPISEPAEATRVVVDVASTVILPTEVRLPSDYDPANQYDLLVALHGFGSSPQSFAELSPRFTAVRLIFAAPQAPTPFLAGESLGFDWDRAHDEPDGSDRRVKFGRASIGYVVDVIETLRERYAIRHVYVFGFSQGAAYAYLVGIYHPDLVSGIAAVGLGFDTGWFEDGMLESAVGVPVLIAHSPEDRRIPVAMSRESAKILRGLDYDVSYYEFSGGHRVTQDVLEKTVRWIQQRSSGSKSPAGDGSAADPESEQR